MRSYIKKILFIDHKFFTVYIRYDIKFVFVFYSKLYTNKSCFSLKSTEDQTSKSFFFIKKIPPNM
jgi:hypothetical protein